MSDILDIVEISDIHLGLLDPMYQWENILECFFKYCEEVMPDIIVVAGDIMDERVNVNTATAAVFHMFIDKLISLGTTVLIIEGTKSHDDGQINVFSHRANENFRIYSKVSRDYVKGLNLLLIPEEYMTDPDDYYKDVLDVDDNHYDFVYGHGMFDHVSYMGRKKTTFRKLTSPMWNYEKHFKKIVTGRVQFGHVHTHSTLDKFMYSGSYGRYNHGEEEEKGFIHTTYDKSKRKVIDEKFVVNSGSKIFKTILESTLPIDRDELLNILKREADNSYRLRIRIDREVSRERLSDLITFTKKNLNSVIDKHYERKKSMKDKGDSNMEGNTVVVNKYEGMNIVDATIEYVLENKGLKLDRERVIQILNSGE